MVNYDENNVSGPMAYKRLLKETKMVRKSLKDIPKNKTASASSENEVAEKKRTENDEK